MSKEKKVQKEKEQTEVLSKIIDNELKTITFEENVSMTGTTKKGKFVAKYMGVAGRLRLGTLRAKLLDGAPSQSLDNLTDDIAYMMAYLSVALIETPKWWNYDDLDEIEDLKRVYLLVNDFMSSFRERNGQTSNSGDSSTSLSTETMENM